MAIKPRPLAERFWPKVDKRGECWMWLGSTNGRYGKIKDCGRDLYAHRASVLLDGRDIPDGMEIDHLCRNKLCVNPKHLEVVTPQVNASRKVWHKRIYMPKKWAKGRIVHGT